MSDENMTDVELQEAYEKVLIELRRGRDAFSPTEWKTLNARGRSLFSEREQRQREFLGEAKQVPRRSQGRDLGGFVTWIVEEE